MAFVKASHSVMLHFRLARGPSVACPPSIQSPVAVRASPSNPPNRLTGLANEACRYGTSLRAPATAISSNSVASVVAAPTKTKKARKGKGKSKRVSQAKAKIAQVQPKEVETHAAVDDVWVPDGQGGGERVRLSQFRTLMLDSSYRPVSVINWQKAMVLEWMQKVDVLEYYSDVNVSSASDVFPLPAVMRCRVYVQKPGRSRGRMLVSKRNILLRDRHTCQYCGSRSELTIDHVLPVSKGGELSWSNCVTACRSCNAKKGNKTLQQLGWKPKQTPREPQPHELAPLRLVPKVAVEVQSAEEHPWENYVSPFLSSYSTAATRP